MNDLEKLASLVVGPRDYFEVKHCKTAAGHPYWWHPPVSVAEPVEGTKI